MKYVLFLMMVLFSGQAVALNCEKQPTCEELNYSKEDDPQCADDGYILCPFDFSYKKCAQPDCEKLGFTSSEKSGWCSEIITCPQDSSYTACNCLKPRCNIGDVFYADGSCGDVKDYTENKIPVGVVYYTNCDGGGKVINLHDLGRESENKPFDPTNPYDTRYRYLYWGYYKYDLEELTNYSGTSMVDKLKAYDEDLYDGQGNTDKILADSGPANCTYGKDTAEYYSFCIPQAAKAAKDFYPLGVKQNDPKVGAGQWYLPAIGELMELYGYDNSLITYDDTTSGAKGNNKTLINNTLDALKGKGVKAEKLINNYYWSSSESSLHYSKILFMDNGFRTNGSKDHPYHSVRVSLQF